MPARMTRVACPNCGRRFNCDGGEDCWCLKVERKFDYQEMILRTGATGCVCPVCLTGRADLAEVEATAPGSQPALPAPRRTGRRKHRRED